MSKSGFTIRTALILVLAFAANSLADYSGGTGEPNSPFEIGTVADWEDLMEAEADWGKHFILTTDLDVNDVSLSPVGNDANNFTGVFDGNGHIIRNVDMNTPDSNSVGLFGCLGWSGRIANIGIEDAVIAGKDNVGGLVGYTRLGSVTNCYATGSVNGGTYVGGLVGYAGGAFVTNCYAGGSAVGSMNVGGLIGAGGFYIVDCYATGSVRGDLNVGGLMGIAGTAIITNCHAAGPVSGVDYVGGLLGYSIGAYSDITNCYATGPISGEDYLGGLVGWNYSSYITNCYATGSLSGNDFLGGLVGYNKNCDISKCYSTSSLSGHDSLGGLVGQNYAGEISNCYSSGWVRGNHSIGGLMGYKEYGRIIRCYTVGSVSGNGYFGGLVGHVDSDRRGDISSAYFLHSDDGGGPDNGYGEVLTDVQMRQQGNFVGWDFVGEEAVGMDDIWRICVDGADYPMLNWTFCQYADFACPDGVGFEDLNVLAGRWLDRYFTRDNGCVGTDMTGVGRVDLGDYARFAQLWMASP